jgi:hypothetical protein
VVSCVFLPLTLVSGIMGMNVPIPGSEINDGDDTYFWCLLGSFALTAIVATLWLNHDRKASVAHREMEHATMGKNMDESAALATQSIVRARRASMSPGTLKSA